MKKDIEVFLSLGSNMGDRRKNLQKAVILLENKIGELIKKSLVYESEAWGNTNQDIFLNQIISFKTRIAAEEILKNIQNIETELGRVRKEKWGPRTIDIDILFYNDHLINKIDLIVPHPELINRKFILLPFAEIAPEFIHPDYSLTIIELLKICKDSLGVEVFNS